MILPTDYVILKFFELGYQPLRNKYNNTYKCGCPICKEGTSFGKKRRCYFIPEKNNIFCHNCGWSSTPLKWICQVSGVTTIDVINELKENTFSEITEVNEVITPIKVKTLPEDCINLSDYNQREFYKDNEAVKVCTNLINHRRLATAVNRTTALYISLKDKVHKHRLIIPFFDEKGDIVYYQSRGIFAHDKKPKYISKIAGVRSLFNLDKISSNSEFVYIFEGPINAFFTRNSVAVAGITEGKQMFGTLQQQQINTILKFHKRIWVLDSQWLDNASLVKTEYLLKNGESVFIWPENLGKRFKDFNDIAIYCKIDEIKEDFIQKNTCSELTGILKLANIKKQRV
jgi:hypothetical protein